MMKNVLFMGCLLLSQICCLSAQTPPWQGKGRIVVSADGNEHDQDDWGATPLTLAILAARRLQDHVPLYIYSDHIWGSNIEHPGFNGITPYEQMKESAVNGGKIFRFNHTKFLCAVDIPELAYEALKAEINRSTADDPLFIIASGPVHVIGEAMARADSSKRQYVTLITMDNCWNNDHADKPYSWWEHHNGWTMQKMERLFAGQGGNGPKIISIKNQNSYLVRNWTEYKWLLTAPERHNPYYRSGSWKWLFNRLCMSIKPVSGEKNYYAIDPSDAGKVIYLLTGIEETSPQLCYEIMRKPVAVN
jgi:hypothetical protein